MSAPPPPPPPPPPALPASNAASKATSPDLGRNLLLQSIRGGKTLKKTVTNDKSAPCISGKTRNGSVNSSYSLPSPPSLRNANNTNTNTSPMGLGGLFAGGMPKLKPTGLRGTIVDRESCPSSPATSKFSPNSNNSSNSYSTIKRGPPPVPPPATQKPHMSSPIINDTNSHESIKGFGKPMLAPKPPAPSAATVTSPLSLQKPCPPPKKFDLTRSGSVSRAQSMRLPRSPPVLASSSSSIHQSQDCLNETQHRQINRILKPPVVRPPSPPVSRTNSSAIRVAPLPPRVVVPTIPPPPPPHRSNVVGHQRLAPPPPPARNLSLSNEPSINNGSIDLEHRFIELFHSIATFPNPEPFRGVPKFYNSKNAAKQQAPPPPPQSNKSSGSMVQLNASSGIKQWQHNAASSAC